MSKFIEETIELDDDLYQKLKEESEKQNITIDELVNKILTQMISTLNIVTVGDFTKILEDANKDLSLLKQVYILVDDFKNPIGEFRPL
jgi:hypothetical protein